MKVFLAPSTNCLCSTR